MSATINLRSSRTKDAVLQDTDNRSQQYFEPVVFTIKWMCSSGLPLIPKKVRNSDDPLYDQQSVRLWPPSRVLRRVNLRMSV